MLGGTVYLFFNMPTGFIPSQDTGFFQGAVLASQDISFESMAKHLRAVADIIEPIPTSSDVELLPATAIRVLSFAHDEAAQERGLNVDEVMAELRPKLTSVPGVFAFLQNPPPITINGQNTNSIYQMTLQSANLQEIYNWVPQLLAQCADWRFLDVTSDMQIQSPQVMVDIERDRGTALGVSPQQIQDAMFSAFGTRQLSTIYTPANQYEVITEIEPEYQRTPAALSKLYVRSSAGPLVPLDSLVKISRASAHLQ